MKYYITIEIENEEIFDFDSINKAWIWAKKHPNSVFKVSDYKSVKRNFDPIDLTPKFWSELRKLKLI